jgi:hypothetical protein
MDEDNLTLDRLETEIKWYSQKSRSNQYWFKHLKIIEIVCAAFIPFSAGYNLSTYITGGLGAVIVVLEGIQGLYQFQQNWTIFRSTAEALKHEKYLWMAKAGPYTNIENSNSLLAERIESLISRENVKWETCRSHADTIKPAVDSLPR